MLEVVRAKEEVELCREEGGMYGRERERGKIKRGRGGAGGERRVRERERERERGRGGGEIIDYKFTEG